GFRYIHEIEENDQNNQLKSKAKRTSIEIVGSFILLALLYCICYGNLDPCTFNLHTSIKNHLFKASNPKVPATGLENVNTAAEYYVYLQSTLLPRLFPVQALGQNLSSARGKFIADLVGFRLGHATLRQLRIRPVDVQAIAKSADYSFQADTRQCFYPGWKVPRDCNFTDSVNALDLAFLGLSARRTNSLPFWGTMHMYAGGGYTAVLPNNFDEASSLVHQLNSSNWIDNYTRTVFVELDLFYPDVNLFSSVVFATEFFAYGGAQSVAQLYTTKLYRYVGVLGLFALITEIMTGLLTLGLLVKTILDIKRERWDYLKSPWNIYTLASFVCLVAAAGFYILRSMATVSSLEAMQNASGLSTNLRYVMYLNETFFYLLGAATFLVQVSFLNMVRFSRNLNHLLGTLTRSLNQLRSFFWVFIIVFMAFTLSQYLIIGTLEKPFRSVQASMITQFSAMLGKFDVSYIVRNGLLARIVFLAYITFIMYIVLNMFVSILNDSYEEVRVEMETAPDEEDFKIIDYIIESVSKIVRGRPQQEYTETVEDDWLSRAEDVEVRLTDTNERLGREQEDAVDVALRHLIKRCMDARSPTDGAKQQEAGINAAAEDGSDQ
uniref:PKD_channel domain-containing protein n=1 Tax=Macrostomum lignano TaxID=282301 RepID=A0A1I8HYH1_9PLAT